MSDTGRREPGPGRKDLDIVGLATRDTIDTANRAGLTLRQHRTLLAVLALTTTWSKVQDTAYLAEVARIAWGTDFAQGWQLRKTSEDLRALHTAGVIVRQAPKGRPSQSAPPRYMVGLLWPNISTETHPEPGVTNGDKAPRERSETHPGIGDPTE